MTTASPTRLALLAHRILDPDPSVHEGFPRLVRAADGRLLLFSRRGTSHAQDPAAIGLRSSFDDGATWSPWRELWRDPAGFCAHNPVPLVTRGGEVVLWCSRYEWQGPRRGQAVISRSGDHGQTWRPFRQFDDSPYRVCYYVTDAVWTGEQWLAGAACFAADGREPCWAEFWRSRDDGASWEAAGALTCPRDNIGDEIGLAATDSGRLLCLLRGRRRPGLYRYWSADGGLSWSVEQNIGDQVGTLQRPQLTRLGHRAWLLTGRQAEASPKTVVSYLSTDDGETWGSRCDLLPYQVDGAYTSAVTRSDGSVLLACYADSVTARMPDLHLLELCWEEAAR